MKILGMDDYDVQARLAPALLAILPIALLAGVWTAQAWTVVTGLVTGLGAAACLAFLLAQLARQAGKKVEISMLRRLGAMPTTLALRHDGPEFNSHTRARYHAFLGAKIGHPLPTAAEQAADPKGADDAFASGIDWLRKHAVDQKDSMVRLELIGYGFRRNLVGVRPVALAILTASILADGAALYFSYQGGGQLIQPGLVVEILLIGALPVWLLVGPKFVEAAGWAYARRLLSLCEGSTTPPRKEKKER